MAKRQKTQPTNQREEPTNEEISAPFDHIYTGRDPVEDRLVTTLLLAGAALSHSHHYRETQPCPASHATPAGNDRPAILSNFGWLTEIAELICVRLAEDPSRAELLSELREALGDGEILRVLLRNSVPAQRSPTLPTANGSAVLSDREVGILREAAGDLSHKEIGERLGIAPGTVDRHFENIYRKLGVRKPMQAVARAITMGYLELDAFGLIEIASHCTTRNFGLFNYLISCGYSNEKFADFVQLALFGLLLSSLGHIANGHLIGDRNNQSAPQKHLYEMDRSGNLRRAFAAHISRGSMVAVAPDQAVRHGFTPGHLFALNELPVLEGLNSEQICEFSPSCRFLRAFCGGKEIGTRLHFSHSLAFHSDGRLLVTTGSLTDAILAFSDGGASIQRFAEGCMNQICIGPSGRVYAAQSSGIGNIIKVFDSGGQLLQTVGGTPAGVFYGGVAVNSRGHIFVNRCEGGRGIVQEYDEAGEFLRDIVVPGLYRSRLTIDAEDRLYVPCEHTADVKILSPNGEMTARIDMHGKIHPQYVSLGPNGRLWIGGQVTA
jgi:DNA-binding CsgD family transcriptional regulator